MASVARLRVRSSDGPLVAAPPAFVTVHCQPMSGWALENDGENVEAATDGQPMHFGLMLTMPLGSILIASSENTWPGNARTSVPSSTVSVYDGHTVANTLDAAKVCV